MHGISFFCDAWRLFLSGNGACFPPEGVCFSPENVSFFYFERVTVSHRRHAWRLYRKLCGAFAGKGR